MTTNVGDSPAAFDDANMVWADEEPGEGSPASETHSADATAASSSEATTTPSTETPREGEGTVQQRGPIPFDRHEAILKAAREEGETFKGRLTSVAWAEELSKTGITAEQVRDAMDLYRGVDADPVGFLERFFPQLLNHPTIGARAKAWAGQLGGSQGQPTAETNGAEAEPQPDYFTQDEAGNKTPFYSGPQLRKWQDWNARKTQADIDKKLSPILAREAEQKRRDEFNAEYQQGRQVMEKRLNEMRQWPHFKEHEADLKTYLKEKEYKVSLEDAWFHVLNTKVLPTLSQTVRAETLAQQRTLAASSSVSPSSAATSTPAAPSKFTGKSARGLSWD